MIAKYKKELFIILLISVLPVFVLWLPFILKMNSVLFLNIPQSGMDHIFRNWDGPHYMIIAKTLYNPDLIPKFLFADVSPSYYPAHFPLYPLFMLLFMPFTNVFVSGLIVNLIFGFLLNVLFFFVIQKRTKYPYFLTFVFTVFPGRFLITRAIVAPETLMVFLIFLSLVLWEKTDYVKSSFAGALGMLSKVKAGFLFPAYFAAAIEKKFIQNKKVSLKVFSALLIPLSLLGLFTFYYFVTGDFFAFLHAETENGLALTFPFAQFNREGVWIGTAWVEDVVFYFFGMFLLVAKMWNEKENRSWFYYALFYTAFLVFVPQRDITRFSMPLYPLFLYYFADFFDRKEVRYAIIALTPAILFYALNFMLQNQAPLANPGVFF